MKRLLLVALLIGMMSSCTQSNVRKKQTEHVINYGDDPLKVVEIEGCEYFKCNTTHGYYTLCHKGNCNNPIHAEYLRK